MKISEEYPDLLKADGFDDAIIGVVERIGIQAICYDQEKVIDILLERDGRDYEEAVEYFEFYHKMRLKFIERQLERQHKDKAFFDVFVAKEKEESAW